MKKIIKYLLLTIFILISCRENNTNKNNTKFSLNSVFDTLTSMNYLFNIKKIRLNLKGFNGVMDDIKFCSVDKKYNIYVLDKSSRVFKFDSNGKYLESFLKVGKGPGEYLGFERFAFDDSNNIYIDNWRMLEIKKYNSKFEFLGNFKTNMAIPSTDIKIVDNKLYCFYPFDTRNSIYIFNKNNFSLITTTGKTDELQKKYFTRLNCGSLVVEGNVIYYILPNYYQIFKIENNKDYKVLKSIASHFKQVSKPIKNPFRDLNNQSSSYRLFKENNYFFLITSPAKNTFKYVKNKWFPTDIISSNGKIIKEAVFFSNLLSPPEKFSDRKYISWGYTSKNNNGTNNIEYYVLILTYRGNSQLKIKD